MQIISYAGRFPAGIEDAVRLATLVVREDSPLKIVPIPHLIALKLYAGGHKSKAEIIKLMVRNPDLKLDEVRAVCARYGLGGLEELIAETRSMQPSVHFDLKPLRIKLPSSDRDAVRHLETR